MINRLDFQFNTNKYYSKSILSEIERQIENKVYSSEDFIVYENDTSEIMVDKAGAVYISKYVNDVFDLENVLNNVEKEYAELCKLDKRFEKSLNYKILTSGSIYNRIIKQLTSLKYKFDVVKTKTKDAIYVYGNFNKNICNN